MNDRSKLLHMLRGKLASGGDEALKITVQINCASSKRPWSTRGTVARIGARCQPELC